MRRIIILLWLMVVGITGVIKTELNTIYSLYPSKKQITDNYLYPMDALDLVKEAYATNFTKVNLQDDTNYYFYKLDSADYYLVYEDTDDITGYYLIHLYEFVIDDTDTGIGHTVTYGWYWVNPYTGDIWVYP
jgi:hypothetical protein